MTDRAGMFGRQEAGSLKMNTACAAHIGMGGVKIKKEPRQRDEYVYRIS
jgi:hypothetical protein